MSLATAIPDQYTDLRNAIYLHGTDVGVYAPEMYQGDEIPIRKKRRMRGRGIDIDDPRLSMTLTEVDGVLRWADGYGYRRTTGMRRSRLSGGVDGAIIAPINFEKLEPNKIGDYLRTLDQKLNPSCNFGNPELGLREMVASKWVNPGVKPVSTGRILIFIHGTFSKNEMFLDELQQTDEGRSLLKKVQNRANYDQVLGFDHATLALSPVLNAMDLAGMFVDSNANVDVICHSRGGLVTRWWLETYKGARGKARAVMVGSPLAGTSLAAAPRLRAAVNLLTNVANFLQKTAALATTAFPFFTVINGLLRVLGSVGTIAAKTPVFDAAIAMIPGLSGQALVDNNEELNRLNRACVQSLDYFAVRSDFEPTSPGWEFWKYFTQIGTRAADWAADMVFDAANDLVVNTASMTVLANPPHAVDIDLKKVHSFQPNQNVYHTIYFRQQETAKFIADCLQLKG
jgi:pimeloyl-ACP methyl ester carboxylesterase